MKRLIVQVFGLWLIAATSLANPIKIYFWHSLSGAPARVLQQTITGFNRSQNHYQVIGVYKGSYSETLTELVAAYRAHQQPAISQVFEAGTAIMMAARGAIVPVYQLMQQHGYQQFNSQQFLPAIASYYADQKGHLISLPLNASAPVLYYNKDAFKKAGLNPDQPPKTWSQLKQDAEALLKAGYQCGYTTAWPAWIQLENFSAWHNIPFASKANGLAGWQVKALYNNPVVEHHLKRLAQWRKQAVFKYGGRADSAQPLFTSGQCPMLTQSSGARIGLQHDTQFAVGVGPMPYNADIKSAPQNAIIGGGSLWVMRGKSPAVYQGVAAFFHYLLSKKIQMRWQSKTGYLPLTRAAYQAAKRAGFYHQAPGAQVAVSEVSTRSPTANSRGIRLGYLPQIRDINDNALESIFSGNQSVQSAMQAAVQQSDRLLKQFARVIKQG